MRFLQSSWFPVILGLIILFVIVNETVFSSREKTGDTILPTPVNNEWQAPDLASLPDNNEGNLIRYGHDLIVNTSSYFGPKGKIAVLTNAMTCQNCHIDAGLKSFGNCFSAVASTYPKYRERSGKVESINFRVRECMERSLNGKPVSDSSKEMLAMVAYLEWVGKDVPKGKKPKGAGLEDLPFIDRAADIEKGKTVYVTKCKTCHGEKGQGQWNADSSAYLYPPLWGTGSYNTSAGIYRLSRFASFVKNNMPFGSASHNAPQLTDEEAWDVAAFVNSQPRPEVFFATDWPKKESKPVDYPFGPYTDQFSEKQHKYGPFLPIQQAKTNVKNVKK